MKRKKDVDYIKNDTESFNKEEFRDIMQDFFNCSYLAISFGFFIGMGLWLLSGGVLYLFLSVLFFWVVGAPALYHYISIYYPQNETEKQRDARIRILEEHNEFLRQQNFEKFQAKQEAIKAEVEEDSKIAYVPPLADDVEDDAFPSMDIPQTITETVPVVPAPVGRMGADGRIYYN